jgi:hypothetical protein
VLDLYDTFPAKHVDGEFIEDAYLFFECRHRKSYRDFGPNCLITGEIIAAYAEPGELLLLPVERQAINILGDRDMRERARRGQASRDRLVGHSRRDRLAATGLPGAGLPDMPKYLHPGRPDIELLGDLLADRRQLSAAVAALALALDDTRLCEVRPVFILASRSSCGDRGPVAGKGGLIGVGQTLSGAASISATPGRPIDAAAPYVDQAPARRAALIERERSGTGQKISATWWAARTSDDAVAQRHAAGLPAGAILSPQQAIDNPRVTAMGLLQEVDFPGVVRPAPVAGLALHFSRSTTGIRAAAARRAQR